MPIYEYACNQCANKYETLVPSTTSPDPECPRCGSLEVRKLVSASGFILKGGGWYRDHYGLKPSTGGDSGGDSAAPVLPPPAVAGAAPAAPAAPATPATPAGPTTPTSTPTV